MIEIVVSDTRCSNTEVSKIIEDDLQLSESSKSSSSSSSDSSDSDSSDDSENESGSESDGNKSASSDEAPEKSDDEGGKTESEAPTQSATESAAPTQSAPICKTPLTSKLHPTLIGTIIESTTTTTPHFVDQPAEETDTKDFITPKDPDEIRYRIEKFGKIY